MSNITIGDVLLVAGCLWLFGWYSRPEPRVTITINPSTGGSNEPPSVKIDSSAKKESTIIMNGEGIMMSG